MKLEDKYKLLDEIEHVRARPGMFIGSIVNVEREEWCVDGDAFSKRNISYNPGLQKIFCEILDNSIDEHKRNPKKLTKINVTIDKESGSISVWDNGGIPVVKHKEVDEYIPSVIFTNLRAGSNFNDDDDQALIGTNGVGSTITAILSTKFVISTCDGIKRLDQTITNGLRDIADPKISSSKKNFTEISFTPDYKYFGEANLTEGNYLKMIRRVYDCAGCSPDVTFTINGNKISYNSFKDYIKGYTNTFVYDENDDWQIALSNSTDGFECVSFVNSVETYDGGTHVDYVLNSIIVKIREFFTKKYKFDLKPAEIKQQLMLFISANINRPKFNSQTKSNMISEPRDYKTEWKPSDAFVKVLLKSDVMKELIEWAERKKELEELAALKKKNKNLDKSSNSLKNITKYEPAISSVRAKCKLFIAEGDSAKVSIQSSRDPNFQGVFPLKGKPLNVRGMKVKDLLSNAELESIMKIVGLQFGVKHKISDLRYGGLVIAADQDFDGYHIAALVINMFQVLWPELLKQGFLYKLQTPIVRVVKGKTELEFMNLADFREWEGTQRTKNYVTTYLKGLGGNDSKYFKKYLSDEKYLIPIRVEGDEDIEALQIAFDKTNADARKKFIYGETSE
jgi:DNA gyrase/topoisomerase IV subunit B